MSLLSRLFGKQSSAETPPVSPQMQIYNQETEALYEEIFDFIEREKIVPNQIVAHLHEILAAKKLHFPRTNDYLSDLIWQITYYKEMEAEMLSILERMFRTKYIPKYKQLEKEIVRIQVRKQKNLAGLVNLNQAAYDEDYRFNPQGKIDALQADFSRRYLKNRLILELIDMLTYSPPLANELFCSTPQFNLETITKTMHNRITKYLSGCSRCQAPSI